MGSVYSVSKCAKHEFSKMPTDVITLIKGEGVEGDAHRGTTVKHRSRVKVDPSQPNLRQVHLLPYELILELQHKGFNVHPSSMGENITTSGIDLLALPTGTILKVGPEAGIEVTGLRNPCAQLDNYQRGLTAAVLDRGHNGRLIRKAGIMAVVVDGGTVKVNDPIEVLLPPEPHQPLRRV
jgi:MOSC domain-containing protein YiiM